MLTELKIKNNDVLYVATFLRSVKDTDIEKGLVKKIYEETIENFKIELEQTDIRIEDKFNIKMLSKSNMKILNLEIDFSDTRYSYFSENIRLIKKRWIDKIRFNIDNNSSKVIVLNDSERKRIENFNNFVNFLQEEIKNDEMIFLDIKTSKQFNSKYKIVTEYQKLNKCSYEEAERKTINDFLPDLAKLFLEEIHNELNDIFKEKEKKVKILIEKYEKEFEEDLIKEINKHRLKEIEKEELERQMQEEKLSNRVFKKIKNFFWSF